MATHACSNFRAVLSRHGRESGRNVPGASRVTELALLRQRACRAIRPARLPVGQPRNDRRGRLARSCACARDRGRGAGRTILEGVANRCAKLAVRRGNEHRAGKIQQLRPTGKVNSPGLDSAGQTMSDRSDSQSIQRSYAGVLGSLGHAGLCNHAVCQDAACLHAVAAPIGSDHAFKRRGSSAQDASRGAEPPWCNGRDLYPRPSNQTYGASGSETSPATFAP
jgi:hypothetical protein